MDLLNSLKGLKDKLNTIENTFTETTEVDNRKPLQERLQEKYDLLIRNQSQMVTLNSGGNFEIHTSLSTINNCKWSNSFQADLKQYGTNEPIFVDMSGDYIVPIVEIMRKSNITPEDKLMTIQLVTADKDHLVDEIKQVFGQDSKVHERCDFVYSSKTEEYRKQLEEEKKKKALLERVWDRNSQIQCWSCGKSNDGNFWKHKYHTAQRENDEYCIGGYYGTCKSCDPNGTYLA